MKSVHPLSRAKRPIHFQTKTRSAYAFFLLLYVKRKSTSDLYEYKWTRQQCLVKNWSTKSRERTPASLASRFTVCVSKLWKST